jgi:hypothetical protein
MDREWPKFAMKISQTSSRITMFILVLILALTISILSQNVTLIPEVGKNGGGNNRNSLKNKNSYRIHNLKRK